ncbi:MAG: hypothetical protein IJ230_07160, partial [Clostridia bacterium]|nr:hypothetical protein [Clostridia bacterium]
TRAAMDFLYEIVQLDFTIYQKRKIKENSPRKQADDLVFTWVEPPLLHVKSRGMQVLRGFSPNPRIIAGQRAFLPFGLLFAPCH